MAFKKGQSGNPLGRSVKDRLFTEALRVAVNEDDEKGVKKLRKIAEKLVDCAVSGESWAIQQVSDRLDGKPMQSVEMTQEVVTYVARIPEQQPDVASWSEKHFPAEHKH